VYIGLKKVVQSGMTVGFKYYRETGDWAGPAEELTSGEGKLLVNSVYWLAEAD